MDDLISRQVAIEVIKGALLAWSNMSGWREQKIIDAIERERVPSARNEALEELSAAVREIAERLKKEGD